MLHATGYMKNHRGVTLLELLIYIAIFASITIVVMNVFFTVSRGSAEIQARNEVLENLRFAASRITRDLRGASGVTTPTASASGNVLTMTISGSPVTYQVSSGVLERVGVSTESITTDKVIVSVVNPIFKHINQGGGAKPTLSIDLTADYNAQDRPDWVFSKRMVTSVGLR